MKSRRAIKGQATGFSQAGVLDSTFYVQGTNLVRRLASDMFLHQLAGLGPILIHSTGPADHLLYVRAPAGR